MLGVGTIVVLLDASTTFMVVSVEARLGESPGKLVVGRLEAVVLEGVACCLVVCGLDIVVSE